MQEDNDSTLANALLGCYLDDSGADEIAQVCDRHSVIMGESEFHAAMDKAMNWLETGDNLDQLNLDNSQKAKSAQRAKKVKVRFKPLLAMLLG
jgi:hypothetical protein